MYEIIIRGWDDEEGFYGENVFITSHPEAILADVDSDDVVSVKELN